MQESQHVGDQISFEAAIRPHTGPGPRLFVLSLLPVVPISRAVRVGAPPADRDEERPRVCACDSALLILLAFLCRQVR